MSYFELRLGGGGDLAVILAPSNMVTHSQLFWLIVGKFFCYFGPRASSYGLFDAQNALRQWNMALGNSRTSRLVPDGRTARATAVLILAFVTGEPILPESEDQVYELISHDRSHPRILPKPRKLRMSFVVHADDESWDVAGKSRDWVFRLHIAENGTLRDLELSATSER
jgi:hypothetical protein